MNYTKKLTIHKVVPVVTDYTTKALTVEAQLHAFLTSTLHTHEGEEDMKVIITIVVAVVL
jgi:hypothetical protein